MKPSPIAQRGKRSLDWNAVQARIQAISDQLESREETDLIALEAVWQQRAAAMAQQAAETESERLVELVIARIGREVYGLEARFVNTIRPLEGITSIPRTPAWLAGVVNVRGRILAALSLDRLFGLPSSDNESSAHQFLVIVETPEDLAAARSGNGSEGAPAAAGEAALVVQEVLAVEAVLESRIRTSSDLLHGIRPEYVRGIASLNRPAGSGSAGDARLVVVLNLAAILADKQLIIREEVL